MPNIIGPLSPMKLMGDTTRIRPKPDGNSRQHRKSLGLKAQYDQKFLPHDIGLLRPRN